MSTATIAKSNAAPSALAGGIVRRFVWKEIRTLRGLWLAVAVMAVMIQWSLNILSPPSADRATMLFSTALAAAVLYAVGAAASTFSLEHEDETYDFLAGLPITWRPVYLGKLAVVAASAVALAGALSMFGWMISGSQPAGRDAQVALGVLGVAILEATAWGILFSLLVKRPLVAAILALVAAAIEVNLAVLLSSSYSGANLRADSYAEATPLRLVFVVLVLVVSAIAARRWLAVGAAPASTVKLRPFARWRELRARSAGRHDAVVTISRRGDRRRMLARLLWQTWRESRKMLLLPIVVAAVLVLGIAVVITLTSPGDQFKTAAWLSAALFIPALYGALAFSADQRRRGYRFLAEHAVRPRFVWLARHVVWLGVPIILTVVVWLAATALGFRLFAPWVFDHQVWWAEVPDIRYGVEVSTDQIIHAAGLAWFGILTAYAVGQLCSMLMRSEILAAFLALIASVVVTAWCAVCFAWQLSASIFVLPIAVAFMLATWLRAPDWIAGRNSWRAWVTPVLAIVAPFILIGVAVPRVRIVQIATAPVRSLLTTMAVEVTAGAPTDIESIIAAYEAIDTQEARETAAMYVRAVEVFNSWHDSDPLDPWQKPQYAKSDKPGEIDEAKIPPEQLEVYRKAKERQQELIDQSKAAAIKLAMEASARPSCFFDFEGEEGWFDQYIWLNQLLTALWSIEPDEPFGRLLAALRMSAHLRYGQPTIAFVDQLNQENKILQQVGVWASHESRTKEELADAIDQMTVHFRVLPAIGGALIAEHLLVENVLLGKTEPSASIRKPTAYLAYLASQLPWERQRALMALGAITRQNLADTEGIYGATGFYLAELGPYSLHKLLTPRFVEPAAERWVTVQPSAATSYLARLEYEARVDVQKLFTTYLDNETCRRAAPVQIALIMYRHDHNAYPNALAELVPDYLDRLPLDPYSGQLFQFEPAGLDLPLRSYHNSNIQRIEANTPFVWSVGAGNARLKQREFIDIEPPENDPRGDLQETRENAYMLMGDELPWSHEAVFVFPLPK